MLNTLRHDGPDATPLLIAHGLFGSARNWGVIGKRLSDARPVTLVDMRNHAGSPWFDSHGYPEMAEDLAQVLDGPAHVLGHSMGGKAAMVLALTRPDLVASLTVVDIAPVAYAHSQDGPLQAMRGLDPASVESRAEARARLGDLGPGVADFLLQSLDLKEKRWRLNLDVLEAEMPRILSFPEIEGRYDGPALFLSGGASDYVRPEHRDRIKALFPKARFAWVPGAGHWLHAEDPRAVEGTVRAFLAAL